MRAAAHFNDAGITLLDDRQIIYREPGFALLEDDSLVFGDAAFRQSRINPRRVQHRFWSDLVTEPLTDQHATHLSAADLVSGQLEQIAAKIDGAELVVAVPATMTSQQMSLLLGIASAINLPIVAMVDAAVAATRREYKNAVPVHIDISLHATTLARLAQPGQVSVERSEALAECGTQTLFDAWLQTIADAFVQQSRFDPLHIAETEQMLLNSMAGWLSEAARSDQVKLTIESGPMTHTAIVDSLVLIAAAAPVYQQIESKLRALFRAGEVPALQLSDRVARLPGLADMLKARVGGELFVLEPGATARGALARCRDIGGANASVSLVRQLPWDRSATVITDDLANNSQAGVPTHVLIGNTAYILGNSPLVLGSEQTVAERMVMLDSGMPGISRRHCALQLAGGQCVLEDFSRYGTFLNGNRVDGSAVLQIGDVLRVGSPGYEYCLITTDNSDG